MNVDFKQTARELIKLLKIKLTQEIAEAIDAGDHEKIERYILEECNDVKKLIKYRTVRDTIFHNLVSENEEIVRKQWAVIWKLVYFMISSMAA